MKKKQSKKKIEPLLLSGRIARMAKIVLGAIIGGVIATTAIAVFARGTFFLEQIAVPADEEIAVRIVSPETGEIIGSAVPVRIYASGFRGISRVELYIRNDISPERVATMYGSGPYFTTTLDTSTFSDHSFETLYAVAYSATGKTQTSNFVHLEIEKCFDGATCAKIFSGVSNEDILSQEISGLTVETQYAVSFQIKRATEKQVGLTISDTETNELLSTCVQVVEEFSWNSANECTFRAISDTARVEITAGDKKTTIDSSRFVYLDTISISTPTDDIEYIVNGSFVELESGWTGNSFQRVGITPVGNAAPFAPSKIFSVSSNIELSATQRIGFSFFKGWPWAHYSWWTRLGIFERPPLSVSPEGTYTWSSTGVDSMKWESPLNIWISRESLDTENFQFNDMVLSVQSDKGSLDICLPNVDWSSPLINGSQIAGLAIDTNGNTYYSSRYADPDALRVDNIARQCTCSDGTLVNTCTVDVQSFCSDDGELRPADCRTCGCATPRSVCEEEEESGVWSCNTALDEIEANIAL